MIDSIKTLLKILLRESDLKYFDIERIKETLSHSIYIYLSNGEVIRLSTHHNEISSRKCLISMVIPVERSIAVKMINQGLELYIIE